MTYSFSKPVIKPALNLFSKIWLIFASLSIALIVLVYFILGAKYVFLRLDLSSKQEAFTQMQAQTKKNQEDFTLFNEYSIFASSIVDKNASNENLRKSLNNLFDIVINSNSIRLSELEMDDENLNIKGQTPTKEMFILLVQTPLKSVFDESSTSFYALKNGWYNFVNTNTNIKGLQE